MVLYNIITIVILIVCVLLGAIVLIQNPKGGGLSATFGQAGNQLLGFQRSTDIVEKWTWGLAIALLVLCLSTVAMIPSDAAPSLGGVQSDPNLVTQPVPQQVPDLNPTGAGTGTDEGETNP
jgi:preprotein translocase subunit SecG